MDLSIIVWTLKEYKKFCIIKNNMGEMGKRSQKVKNRSFSYKIS